MAKTSQKVGECMKKPVMIGCIPPKALSLIGIQSEDGFEVYLGASNIKHMKSSHPLDYARYGDDIGEIVSKPDYIGLNPKDSSIECVKEYIVDGEYVKVAVRASMQGKHYARSVYALNKKRTLNFLLAGTLRKT